MRSIFRRLWPAITPAAAAPSLDVSEGAAPVLSEETEAAGLAVSGWVERARARQPFHIAAVPAMAPRWPDRAEALHAQAERLLTHEFDLLGSGPFTPIDPERPARDGYQPIDWYLDPVRNLRFRRGVPVAAWNLYEMRPANADIKYPWELARCQHWATLGQAFALTGDERFAAEIFRQLEDFTDANPVGVGINWTCTMDVALRALNWAIGLSLVRRAESIDASRWGNAYQALLHHGIFIERHLENKYEVTSNHFLSNVVGLYFLAAVFEDLTSGQRWNAQCREWLEQEMRVQVLPDGADYESSVPYHRLVTELFLGSARLAEYRQQPLSSGFRQQLRSMVEFLVGVMRPDGLMPQVGDADDGRLHILTDFGSWRPQDPRHLFGPAGAMFAAPEWIALGGEAGSWEASWWGYDVGAEPAGDGRPPALARLFPDAGLAVARANGHYLLVTNGIVGTRGFGNHKHNDQLGFEYHASGTPIIVDAGSFVYTSDFDARNLFRGTAYHNTLEIDGIEQNDLRPEWIFRLFETSHAEHVSFSAVDRQMSYHGRHRGYARLEHPVTHERGFHFETDTGRLNVTDRLDGLGRHSLRWHFHLAPDVSPRRVDGRTWLLVAEAVRVMLKIPAGLEATVTDQWYSPSYGTRVPGKAVDLRLTVDLQGTATYAFSFGIER